MPMPGKIRAAGRWIDDAPDAAGIYRIALDCIDTSH